MLHMHALTNQPGSGLATTARSAEDAQAQAVAWLESGYAYEVVVNNATTGRRTFLRLANDRLVYRQVG